MAKPSTGWKRSVTSNTAVNALQNPLIERSKPRDDTNSVAGPLGCHRPSHSACGPDNSPAAGTAPMSPRPLTTSGEQARTMEIRLKAGDKKMTATLIDSETTRDFISLLPLSLTMNDLFGRENLPICREPSPRGGFERRPMKLARSYIGHLGLMWRSFTA
jgi:hypothetical protein